MSDNPFTNGNGGLPSTQFRSTDTATGQAFHTKSAPWIATVLGVDVNVAIGGAVVKHGAGLTVPTNTSFVFFSIEAGDARLRRDSTDPTALQGILHQAGFLGELELGPSQNAFRLIASASSPVATAFGNFEYRRYP